MIFYEHEQEQPHPEFADGLSFSVDMSQQLLLA
jgi:hypothetical protein